MSRLLPKGVIRNAPTRERRRYIPAHCLKCKSRQACALSRAGWFQQIMKVSFYGRNATVLRQGEPASSVLAIRHGWVQVTHLLPNGRAVTDLLGPGSVLGVAGAVTGANHSYTAVTLEECEIESVDTGRFLEFLRRDPDIAVDLLRFVSRQAVRITTLFYQSAGKVPSEERLLETLREIAAVCSAPADGGVRINLPLQVQVLAEKIGCSRQWVSRMLVKFESRGVLKRNGPWFTLLDGPAVAGTPVPAPRPRRKARAALKAASQPPLN